MHSATAEAVETMRQLQKLSRELQPVKVALASLINREKKTPNHLAAARSLDKIASRIAEVNTKYGAFIERTTFLLDHELPRLQRTTPIMACEVHPPVTPLSSKKKKYKHSESSASSIQGPFAEVCSPAVPYLLNPENYRMTQERICMEMEIVDYLIATEHYHLAQHVANVYGIPLFWFPKLLSIVMPALPPIQSESDDKSRDSSLPLSIGTSPFLTVTNPEEKCLIFNLTPEYIAIHHIEANHSVVEAIAYSEEKLLPVIERLDASRGKQMNDMLLNLLLDLYAIRLLQLFRDGHTDQQSILQYIARNLLPQATRRPSFVQTIINTVTRSDEPYTQQPQTKDAKRSATVLQHDARKNEEGMRLVASLMSVEGFHKLAVSFHRVAVLFASLVHSSCAASNRRSELSADGEPMPPEPSRVLPDLVTRVVATAIFLKDEYFERLVLRRQRTAEPPIPPTHRGTQSDSAAFDESMMVIVEEILRKQTTTAGGPGFGDEKGERGLLSAEELLKAEERWSNDVLFIKRPTRFYCYHTMECLDGGTGKNYPIALPNGTIVSKVAVMQKCMKKKGDGDHISTVVVCPRTQEEFSVSSLRRIYVT